MTQLGVQGIDASRPVDWQFGIPEQPELTLQDAFPRFFEEFDSLRSERPDATQFELLREVVGGQDKEGSRAEVETRHFLALAYRFFTHDVLHTSPIDRWRWFCWFRSHAHLLVTSVSFNYDLLLERVLHEIGKPFSRMHKVDAGVVRVFKPHGSADFDLVGLTRGKLKYPLRHFAHMNNCPFRTVSVQEWGHPPSEALIVLPYETNPYSNYQWVAPGYSIFKKINQHPTSYLTHCLFIGLSYHPADRREIDHFLYSTRKTCRIIVANRTPPRDFLDAVRASGRELYVWRDGPEPLPV